MNRRDFFGNFAAKSVTTASALALPVIAYATDWKEDILNMSNEFGNKLTETTAELTSGINRVSQRLDAAALNAAYQQVQLYFIFLLLIVSFVIDGGIVSTWLLV